MKTETIQRSVKLDLRNEVCPLSFVRTKVEIDKMEAGQVLEVILRGAAIENVPRSVEKEGHTILRYEKLDGDFVFFIRKEKIEDADHACAQRDCVHCRDILKDQALEARRTQGGGPENTLKSLEACSQKLENATAEQVLRWSLDFFGESRVALSNSFRLEDMVLTDMLLKINPNARIFTLDTGRLHQETYDVLGKAMKKYGLKVEIFCPDTRELEELTREFGPNMFYENIENRISCCQIRKINPLKRALSTMDAWICGLRREQSPTRTDITKVELGGDTNIIAKINPLADWTEKDVWDYIRKHDVPHNALHGQGFPSIGCAPCTRALKEGEDIRAGRWWWEQPAQKECGLHKRK